MSEPLLQVFDADVYYGPIQALRKLTIEVGAGEMVALLGPNGAGKSTTLRTVSGMMQPRNGVVVFDGEDVTGQPPYEVIKRGLAHLPEGRELFASMTVEDNLHAGYWIHRKHGKGYAAARDRVMDHFPILRERRKQVAGTLSGGEQQMLAVARALMSEPKLLVVDELSLGLAPMIVSHLVGILQAVNATGTAVLLVEQFVHTALQSTHRAYVLAKGEVVLEGKSEDLVADEQILASYLGGSKESSSSGARKRRNGSTGKRRRRA